MKPLLQPLWGLLWEKEEGNELNEVYSTKEKALAAIERRIKEQLEQQEFYDNLPGAETRQLKALDPPTLHLVILNG